MIKFYATVKGLQFTSTVYHRFDIEDYRMITDWKTACNKDKNKYIMFDDGSELYGKINYVGSNIVNTSCGSYFINDIIHSFQPKYMKSTPSGVFHSEQSLQVLPLGRQEKSLVTRTIGGERLQSTTPRIEAGVTSALSTDMLEAGITTKMVAAEMVAMALNPKHSPQKLKALENCARVLAREDVTKIDNSESKVQRDLGAIEKADYSPITEEDQEMANELLRKIKGGSNVGSKDINTSQYSSTEDST